jgi:sialate O-acetylesterase
MRLVPALALIAATTCAWAEVSLPRFFSDHAVLQREAPIPVWGWAAPGEKITVQLGDQAAASATAAADGTWKVALPKSAAGGPFVLSVKGTNEIRLNDVLVGEVWICSGQSNMEWTVNASLNPEQERSAATDPLIRHLGVPKRPLSASATNIDATWVVAAPNTAGNFTACGYFMARELRKHLNVPVGLINASWGGTRIEPWCTPASFGQVPALSDIAKMLAGLDPTTDKARFAAHLGATEAWLQEARVAAAAGRPVPPQPVMAGVGEPLASRKDPHQQPTTLYHGMVHALVGYGMRGAIWYQGESNHYEGPLYTEKMKALINGWRAAWGIGDFPFNFVQIAPYQYGGEDPGILPRFWAAQQAALAIPNTGMVVTTDISDINDIHPRNKQEVGRRLALIALKNTYGKSAIVDQGPMFSSAKAESGAMRVVFTNADGLKTRDGKAPDWFELIGEDSEWTRAEAKIDGTSVVVSSPAVKAPVAVRFSWHKNAEPNLANGAGLPAPAFSSGGIPYVDQLTRIDEAKGWQLVYELDLARLGASPAYTVDHSAKVGAFDRVGYLVELQKEGRGVQYVWTAMDAFTKDARKLGVPVASADAVFQQAVANLTVASNAPGITSGAVGAGNIEFWPHNYAPANVAGVAGASNEVYDLGDQYSDPKDGYGSMQVHNTRAKQTIFAINNFKAGAGADLGIGNSEGKSLDWTFSGNAGTYVLKKLRVLVRSKK